jgi:hypothetical protein
MEANQTEAQSDDDDGASVLHPMLGNRWIFQCKREKEVGPKRVNAILDEIAEDDPPYGYPVQANASRNAPFSPDLPGDG